ncbi:MAG: polyprenyl diphosphate synthase [Porphyromonas sp.]|nr:polyprenyl diphosphate synthase [Porphyromonas sp.]
MNTPTTTLEGLRIPQHVAIIMDGNGRWAKERGLPRTDGHIQGQESLRNTLKAAAEFGIKCLTVYAFSTENWNRPDEEVNLLMELLVRAMHDETPELIAQGVRVQVIGDLSRLPEHVLLKLDETIQRTAEGERITLCVALSYSGRDELVRTIDTILRDKLESEDELDPQRLGISEDLVEQYLDTRQLPELDLMIRTGKEKRISNFLLWQVAYAELYFSDCYWPDFGKEALLEAIVDYNERERRYGKTSEQIRLTDED